ncbi:uncharacterized protein LOC105432107 [Pogonomyrmex barbatus]|uniref:Odorant receptor n=1 Tax=Pogonomyrmex barbatus TaxID=144034 RepID=A0A6I9XHN3_9HYME|nr:uncharacterized protein LOC105432107 [Pogonomyrmex barbatus]
MYSIPMQKSSSVAAATIHDEKDMQLSMQLNRWMLKPIGAWPKSDDLSRIEKLIYLLLNTICSGLIVFLFVPAAVFMVFEVDDVYHRVKLFGHLLFCVMAIVKYSAMMCRENDIRRGIQEIEDDWISTRHYDDQIIMIESAKFGRRLIVISGIFMYGGAAFYYFALPLMDGKIIEDDGNLTYWPLVYPVARVIVDVRYSPANDIFFSVQCLSGVVAHCITAGACSLAATFAMHAHGRLRVLAQWIKHLIDGREDLCSSMNKRLAMIVQQHVRILRFISLTDKILREMAFIDIFGCTLNMCFLGYYTITEWEDKNSVVIYIILLLSLAFNIFIFCYIGELVTEQCKKIGDVSYMIDWHRLSGNKGLAIILISAMSNSSIKLTVANIIELSLSTFGNVINTSVAYLNMLRTLT